MVAEDRSYLPWVEKYRPATLGDLISHTEIISTINKFINQNQLPHLLFYGPPGTGKTSTILACARQLYTPAQFNSMVLELNASDDRGINIVRGQILNFASTRTIFSGGFKLIILDEADAMTNDAQNALRRIIEKYTDNVRFCVICNYLSKIIPAVQSRCTRFRFAPLVEHQIVPRLNYVIDQEQLKVSEDGKKALVALSGGDMRKVLNVLQSTWMAYKDVTEVNVYQCVGHPQRADIDNIMSWLLNDTECRETYQKMQKLKADKGLALEDILREIHLLLMRIELPPRTMCTLLVKMAAVEARLAAGCAENIQIAALISSFHLARDTVTLEARRLFVDYRLTEVNVYQCVGHPQRADIDNIMSWLLNDTECRETYQKMQKLKADKGLALEDILREIHLLLMRIELPPRTMCTLLVKMAAVEARLAAGCAENIQIAALISSFHLARDTVTLEA